MSRIKLFSLAMVVALGLVACRTEVPGDRVLPHVNVKALEPEGFTARYEISVMAQPDATVSEHMVALLEVGAGVCVDRNFDMDWAGIDWQQNVEQAPPAGKKLSILMSCHHDKIPNHRTVGADASFDLPPVPAGSASLEKDTRYGDDETALRASERITGFLLRRAFTEDCSGRFVSVESLDFRTQPNNEFDSPPTGQSMHGRLQFRCTGSDAAAATAEPSAQP